MLGPSQVVPLLLQHGLLSPERILTDDIRVTGARCRNSSFHVTGAAGPGFFIKQDDRDDAPLGTIRHEGTTYELLGSLREASPLANHLATCVVHDPDAGLLVLESIPHAEDLRRYHDRLARFPRRLALASGHALGTLHDETRDWPGIDAVRRRLPTASLPFVFNLATPPASFLRDASAGSLELVRILQDNPPFGAHFTSLATAWRTTALIHGDVRLANLVVHRRRARGPIHSVVLVDWEFACLGEPLWDLGALLASYVALWLTSVPIARPDQPDELMHLARFPLERIQPFLRAVWQSYCAARRWDEATAAAERLVATRLMAVSLVHTAYEMSLRVNRLTHEIRSLLQVSLNVLEAPEQAAAELLQLCPTPIGLPS